MYWPRWGVTSVTLFKLSLRNAKRQARDYLVYFVTIVLAAALIYAFNGIVFSREIQELSALVENLTFLIATASIVVVCIIGWLVSYTTRFMLTRRSRELGTYILIGLENKQVARMFFVENLVVGGCALVLGLLAGSLLYQALRAVVLTLFGTAYRFALTFSPKAVALTLVYFLLIYLLAQRKSRKRIRRMKIYDLIYFERRNETAAIQSSRKRQILFMVSLILGVVGTVLFMGGELLSGTIGFLCILFFLYGFFLSFASGVPAFFEKHAAAKYRGQTLLVFRTLTAKLSTMGVVMATVSLLFTGVLVAQGTGTTFSNLFRGRAAENACFDLFVSTTEQARGLEEYLDYVEEQIPVEEELEYSVYWGEDKQFTQYLQDNVLYIRYYQKDLLLRYSDYAALRSLLGYPPVELGRGEYLIHAMPYLEKDLERCPSTLTLGGAALERRGIYTEQFNQYGWDANGANFILVVPDAAAQGYPARHRVYVAKTAEPVTQADFDRLTDIRIQRMETRTEENELDRDYDSLHAKAIEEENAAATITMTVFPLYYLAIILIMTAATILTIQQLSESAHYRRQFALLRKLGMERREMEGALGRQFAIFYAMPVLPALLISIPTVWHFGWLVEPGILEGRFAPPVIVALTLALFFLVYGIYILMAYTSMRRNVLPD